MLPGDSALDGILAARLAGCVALGGMALDAVYGGCLGRGREDARAGYPFLRARWATPVTHPVPRPVAAAVALGLLPLPGLEVSDEELSDAFNAYASSLVHGAAAPTWVPPLGREMSCLAQLVLAARDLRLPFARILGRRVAVLDAQGHAAARVCREALRGSAPGQVDALRKLIDRQVKAAEVELAVSAGARWRTAQLLALAGQPRELAEAVAARGPRAATRLRAALAHANAQASEATGRGEKENG